MGGNKVESTHLKVQVIIYLHGFYTQSPFLIKLKKKPQSTICCWADFDSNVQMKEFHH